MGDTIWEICAYVRKMTKVSLTVDRENIGLQIKVTECMKSLFLLQKLDRLQ